MLVAVQVVVMVDFVCDAQDAALRVRFEVLLGVELGVVVDVQQVDEPPADGALQLGVVLAAPVVHNAMGYRFFNKLC